MKPSLQSALTFVELALFLSLCIRLLRHTKYEKAPKVQRPTFGDCALAIGAAGLLTALRGPLPFLTYVGCGVLLTLLLILWLDVALYGSFSFELGLSGITDVVLSNLVTEVLRMRCARQFFLSHRIFSLLPLMLPLCLLLLFLQADTPQHSVLLVVLSAYFASAFHQTAWGGHSSDAVRPSSTRRALLHDFVRPRLPVIASDFCVRPEHLCLFEPQTPCRVPSESHGLLRGASVVLLTFESLGSSQLTSDGAVTPFLTSLCSDPHSITSDTHVSLAPLTNAAHVALYYSRHKLLADCDGNRPPHSHVEQLAQAGYLNLYLTATTAEHYGLATILRQAGFAHLIDGLTLSQTAATGHVTDSVLLRAGLAQLSLQLQQHSGPFFLHVHAANSHLPYHIDEPERFNRHDSKDDCGRFLNSIEETDALFGTLWNALRELEQQRGVTKESPLLFVGSDHGQSFGEHGYRSHGSAVIAAQTQVPMVFHHPRLSQEVIPFSTHFQVLPTILDLLGIPMAGDCGSSILAEPTPPRHLLWDGQPSRSTSGCLGLLLGDRKYSLDLIRDTCIESDWNDRAARQLDGEERRYFEGLIGLVARHAGVLR